MKKFATQLLLKNKEQLYSHTLQPHTWNAIALEFILVSILGLALFGVVIAQYYPTTEHIVDLAWKTIVLVWAPIVLCSPSLYVFGALRGSRISVSEMVFLLLGTLATSGIVLLALTPVTWFFIWTTESVEFIQAMNAFIVGISLAFGLFYFGKGSVTVQRLKTTTTQDEQGSRMNDKTKRSVRADLQRIFGAAAGVDILFLWFVLLLVVVVQMSQKLGPWYEVL